MPLIDVSAVAFYFDIFFLFADTNLTYDEYDHIDMIADCEKFSILFEQKDVSAHVKVEALEILGLTLSFEYVHQPWAATYWEISLDLR